MRGGRGADDPAMFRLVFRLFLRRLIDNDVISPHADRHESLAMLYGLVVTLGVFATFFLSVTYLSAFIQLPGPAAMSALSDRFLLATASTTISALGALMVWDALALEPRDAAILGPLPIAARTITGAKLAAVSVFGTALTVGFNAVPSVLYPAFLTLNIRGVPGTTILRLIAAHATTTIMAGLFGFFTVFAMRGFARLVLGERRFRPASSGLQSVLVVSMITALLLAPTVRTADVRNWIAHTPARRWPVRPVLWYLGLNETLAGHLVADIPIVLPPGYSMIRMPTRENQAARTAYRALLPEFVAIAPRAWLSLLLATVCALATFFWTNRRLPDRSVPAPGLPRIRTRLRRMAERYTERDPETQAGFFFTLQTVTRSAPHRTVVAIAVAVGLTHALVVLTQIGRYAFEIPSMPTGALAIGVLSLLSLLGGVVYAGRVPAAPAANWTIRMAWLGDEGRYLAGVKRAALGLAALLVVILMPLHVALLGTRLGAVHSVLCLLFATVALDMLWLPARTMPFACSYVPIENPKLVWPAAAVCLLLATYGFARVERWALQSSSSMIVLALSLASVALLVRCVDRARRRERRPVDFEGRPARATQQLGLFAHVTGHD